MADALMPEATARSEARRGTFDPTYGIYTWGKWLILDAREQATTAVGGRSSRCVASTTRCSRWGRRRSGWCATAVDRG